MLHSRRKRQAELADKEAAGIDVWTKTFSSETRWRLINFLDVFAGDDKRDIYRHAQRLICLDEGLPYLTQTYHSAAEDMHEYVQTCPDAMMPTAIEALVVAMRLAGRQNYSMRERVKAFEETLVTVLREARVAFDLIDGEMVEITSQELHTAVVAPALALLHRDEKWAAVEKAYRDALDEIANGSPADAITDAGTALQETFNVLGCTGNALGPLIKSASSKGLLGPHDSQLTGGLEKILHWVSADRSEMGDAHAASAASVQDAWLTVHIVGALILRLSAGTARRS